MIDFFSSWVEQIIISIIAGSIIEMILPDNKNKKYIKMVIGIYILFSIISPIINNKNDLKKDVESFIPQESLKDTKLEKVNQESMDERLEELYIEELENSIKNKVEQEKYKVYSCKVDAVLFGDNNKKGINKINIVLSEKIDGEKSLEKEQNLSAKNNIKNVEINVGLEKIIRKDVDEESEISKNDIQNLKNSLSSYYEVDNKKINITVK